MEAGYIPSSFGQADMSEFIFSHMSFSGTTSSNTMNPSHPYFPPFDHQDLEIRELSCYSDRANAWPESLFPDLEMLPPFQWFPELKFNNPIPIPNGNVGVPAVANEMKGKLENGVTPVEDNPIPQTPSSHTMTATSHTLSSKSVSPENGAKRYQPIARKSTIVEASHRPLGVQLANKIIPAYAEKSKSGTNKKSKRKPFSDMGIRKETSLTRQIKACLKCRMQRIRVRFTTLGSLCLPANIYYHSVSQILQIPQDPVCPAKRQYSAFFDFRVCATR
jgi:hypothetical protein